MSKKPKISILISALNEELYLSDCIVSCLNQSYKDIEILLFNDGSTDRTHEIAIEFIDRIKYFHSPKNIGKVKAFNALYAKAEGEYIHLMGADDVMVPHCIETLLNEKKKDNCHHALQVVDKDLRPKNISIILEKFFEIPVEQSIVERNSLPSGSLLIHRSLADDIFPIPDGIPYEDIWISYNIFNHIENFSIIDKDLILYRQHDENLWGGIGSSSFQVAKFRAERDAIFLGYLIYINPFGYSLEILDCLGKEKKKLENLKNTKRSFQLFFKQTDKSFYQKIKMVFDDYKILRALKRIIKEIITN